MVTPSVACLVQLYHLSLASASLSHPLHFCRDACVYHGLLSMMLSSIVSVASSRCSESRTIVFLGAFGQEERRVCSFSCDRQSCDDHEMLKVNPHARFWSGVQDGVPTWFRMFGFTCVDVCMCVLRVFGLDEPLERSTMLVFYIG